MNVVLTSPALPLRAREALSRALARFPAAIETVPCEERALRLRALAADSATEWLIVVDDDVVLAADAFGSLRRSLGGATALVGGRALSGAHQRLGGMFGPARSGPNPFEFVPLAGLAADRGFTDAVRGPLDVPARGAFVVAADFVRSLGDAVLDPIVLHLDLAVHARAAGRAVMCEPALSFACDDDSAEVVRRLLDMRRFAGIGTWERERLHRDPARVRALNVTREVRIMGNIRGYARNPYPPIDVLAIAEDELARARAQRTAAALGGRGAIAVAAPRDGAALRDALSRTGDTYLLVADVAKLPDRAGLEALAERLERSGRVAIALDTGRAGDGAALIHRGRIVNAAALPGGTVTAVLDAAIAALPPLRLFAANPHGEMVPATLPPLPPSTTIDAVFVAASRPVVTQQAVQALMGEPVNGTIAAVYPAGSTTIERIFGAYAGLRRAPDDTDAQLAVGLNHALAACRSDVIAIVRDDVQVPRGLLARLHAAFRRIPRLGAAVPRVGGTNRPESLPDLGYRDLAEMQAAADRRADAYAREVLLLDVATAPVIMIARAALDVVGGFDEMFGFSRAGIEDFTRRLRSANYLVARCDDAYAHLFPQTDAQSFVGNLDDAPFLRAAFEKRWSAPRGFDPQRDRVVLTPAPAPASTAEAAGGAPRVRVLLPLADDAEWRRAVPLIADLAAAFRAHDAVDLAIGLDGTFDLQTALAGLRELLTSSGVPMEETLNVSIDFVGNVAEWRDAGTNNMRAAGFERDDLAALPVVAQRADVTAHLTVPAP